MQKPMQPQEIEVFYIMPAIRRELTIAMKELGYTQKKIAQLLGVTEPAISQYLSKKRAVNIEFSEELKEKVKEAAKNITDHFSLVEQMQHLMRLAHDERTKCGVCHKVTGTPHDCGVCYEGKEHGTKKTEV